VLLAGRRRLTVVSSLRAEELDESRLRGEGPKLFRAVLMAASHPKAISHSTPDPLDPLLADLAGRVERRGAHVTANYGYQGCGQWRLAVRPEDGPSQEAVAVLTDDAASAATPSIRALVRYRPAALERAGWALHCAWTSAVFMDPEAEARRIAHLTFAKR
jgi:hypothetical protein